MSTISFDAAALTSAASKLADTAHQHPPAVAEPPGADATSISAIAQLNAASAALSALLAHGSAVRKIGATALSGTAALLSAQDDANAAAISAGSAPTQAAAAPAVPTVPTPTIPAIPQVPVTLPPLPGEAHSHALYGGAGTGSLHAFAEQWERSAAQLHQAASSTLEAADTIDSGWSDGRQRAGANTREHGQWLSDMSEHALTVASHARTVAQQFETAKSNTPSPQEFTQARQELQQAIARFEASRGANAPEVQQKSQEIAQKQAEATAAAAGYHSAISSPTLSALSDQIKTAPAIARGGGQDSTGGQGDIEAADWKPGDKRHYPIIRGHNGLGPAQPADGPYWVEIGPRSGMFVRSDELPNLTIHNPGALGPAPFYDRAGGEHGWMELVPGSGAWVPDNEFPNAVIKSPGSLGPFGYEEYLPGSGIWLPSSDLIRDPADPAPPRGTTLPA